MILTNESFRTLLSTISIDLFSDAGAVHQRWSGRIWHHQSLADEKRRSKFKPSSAQIGLLKLPCIARRYPSVRSMEDGHRPASMYLPPPTQKGYGATCEPREHFDMLKSATKLLPSLSVRIDLNPEARIGPGKILLLENIDTCGSISAAGRAMDMSYKRAWDLVDEINRICRQAAVERQTGGKNGGGAVLTPFGKSLVARYRKIERDAASAVRKELQALRTDIARPKKNA
jgi:molybdate transport system regulatory protein